MGSVAGCTKAVVLGSSLVVTALLMALALTSPAHSSLAWFSLLPLFWAIRFQGPTTAAFCGGVWGISLYLFSTIGPAPAIPPTLRKGLCSGPLAALASSTRSASSMACDDGAALVAW